MLQPLRPRFPWPLCSMKNVYCSGHFPEFYSCLLENRQLVWDILMHLCKLFIFILINIHLQSLHIDTHPPCGSVTWSWNNFTLDCSSLNSNIIMKLLIIYFLWALKHGHQDIEDAQYLSSLSFLTQLFTCHSHDNLLALQVRRFGEWWRQKGGNKK